MNKQVILAYDLGTSGNKVILYRPDDGTLLESGLVTYPVSYASGNWAEQDANSWWEAVCEGTNQVLHTSGSKPRDVACVTFSGQMMGCVPVDSDGRSLRPAIIWADQRASGQAENIARVVGLEKMYRITGHRVSPSYSAAKIMWIRENEPEIFEKTYKFLQAKDYIALRLTGNFVTDYSDASGTNLFDLTNLVWSKEILQAIDLPKEKLPVPYPSTAVIGYVNAEAGQATGLAQGTPVVIGGGDGSCAAAGAGAIGPGIAYNYIGSSSWIGIATSKPIFDGKMRTFNWVHVIPNYCSPTGTMQAAGASYQWLRDELCTLEREVSSKQGVSVYAVMDNMAARVPPGSENLLFLPYLLGERSPRWNPKARGVFIGLTIRHSRSHFIRAVMEGVALNLRAILDSFRTQGADVSQMRLIGGAAKSPVWGQIMADIYGVPIYKSKFPAEATSLGAALTGAVGIGLLSDFSRGGKLFKFELAFVPDKDSVKTYQKLYEVFNRTYDYLVPIFEELS
ncbi:xylulose kinase [Peptococcaceae bacterium CEB3]|nr:xylulose kinase [Peptococcaceae bacterium CEB3]